MINNQFNITHSVFFKYNKKKTSKKIIIWLVLFKLVESN